MVNDSEGLHSVLIGDEVARHSLPIAGTFTEVRVDCGHHGFGITKTGDNVVHLLQAVGHAVFHPEDGCRRQQALPLLLILREGREQLSAWLARQVVVGVPLDVPTCALLLESIQVGSPGTADCCQAEPQVGPVLLAGQGNGRVTAGSSLTMPGARYRGSAGASLSISSRRAETESLSRPS